ncbi:Sec34-like family-domain-containing protein [Scheffersomyces coipomensis]|uniref:Sec34-like family-domain-containing protein n=1 Tax=Scheffersomyces coipomensis TaxID=1788519 RepID=UPI00315D4F5D
MVARGRSKSIVQKIAADVPSYNEDHLNLGDSRPSTPTASTYKLTKSKSLIELNGIKHDEEEDQTTLLDYPLNAQQSDKIWSTYIDSYNYDCLLSFQDINCINNLHIDNVLNFQNSCAINQVQIKGFMDETDDILNQIHSLLTKYDQISHETIDFDQESSHLLNQQNSYQQKYTQIENYLRHFENLDAITRNLSKSGNHLLNQRRDFFINTILRDLDESIEFIRLHPKFKDIELYDNRFNQCLTRSLTLIKNYLISELKGIYDGLNKKLQDDSKRLTIDLLIFNEFNEYLKFNDDGFKDFINEIIIRIQINREYQGLLNDILNNYFRIRANLLRQYIPKHLTFNKKSQDNIVQLCQDQISFFKKVIEREFTLFKRFFVVENSHVPSFVIEEFYSHLKDILEPLYDNLRQLILREINISKLCQLTSLLQKYYEFEDDNDSLHSGGGGGNSSTLPSINYGELFQPILDDVQQRLIFRTQIYVDDKLMKYKPKPEDLKVGNRKKSKSSSKVSESTETPVEIIDALEADYPDNLFPDVYLPLAKALTLLSSIYELINSVVFDDLAHYIVHACIILLKGEFYKLSITFLGTIDAQLEYIKNLIVLKTQINNFDIQYTRNDYTIDFTSGLSDIWHIFRSKSLDRNTLLEVAYKTVPKVVSNMIDANYEIELELNNAVTFFIDTCSRDICEPLSSTSKDKILTEAKDINSKFKHNLLVKIPQLYKQTKIYIDNPNIIEYLMNSLTNLIVLTYENDFYKIITDGLSKIEIKDEIDDIMEVDTLFGFINELVINLYEPASLQEQVISSPIQFNEDILDDLTIDDIRNNTRTPDPDILDPIVVSPIIAPTDDSLIESTIVAEPLSPPPVNNGHDIQPDNN